MRLAVVCLLVLSSVAAGCYSPCTGQPTRATVDFDFAGSEGDLLDEMRALGWELVARRQGALPRMSLEVEAGTVFANVDMNGPAGVRVEMEGPTVGETTLDAARVELGPAARPLGERFGATPDYFAGVQHCGAV